MKIRNLTFLLLLAVLATFLTRCGAPVTNNAAGNQIATNVGSNSNAASNAGASKAAASVCTPSDDPIIEAQIRLQIDADPALFAQRRYINFFSKYCNVKLQGELNSLGDFKNLYDRVNHIDGVRKIDISGITRVTPMERPIVRDCPYPTERCGAICIPGGDPCNIPSDTGTEAKSPNPTGTRAP